MAIPWHRIFGMALTQYFAGTAWKVEVEIDLSLQQQRLDVAVVRREIDGPQPHWPDGFGPPADYNLLTFKALKDPLSDFALKELSCHRLNYRKQVSPDPDNLLPETSFRMLAATMHYPRQLASLIPLRQQGAGVYDVQWGTDVIRILVLREMPETEQNLVWNLFSGDEELIGRTFERLQPRVRTWSSILNDLLNHYGLEGIPMPYTLEDYERDVLQETLQRASPEQLLARLTPEQLLARLTPEQRTAGLSPEQLLAVLPPETIDAIVRRQNSTQDPNASS